jgi:hypothetical protein
MKPLLVLCCFLPAMAFAQQAMYENNYPNNASGIFTVATPVSVSAISTYAGYLTNGLIEWNRFNDGSGSIASDVSGHGNLMPLVGSPKWGSDFLAVNGANQYGDAGTNQLSSLDFSDLSICAWVKKNSSSYKAIFDKSFDIPGFGYGGWSLRVLPNNQLEWWIEDGQEFVDDGPASLTPGQWAFVTVVWNFHAAEAQFYINGLLNSDPIRGAAVQGPSSLADLQLGNMQNNASNGLYAFDGCIRDVAVYNRALTAPEVESNFLQTGFSTNGTVPDLLYYRMTEAAQTNPPALLADSSTHGGTIGSVFANFPTPIQWTTNNVSIPQTALKFDGVSTFIDTSNSTLFNFTTNLFTVNFWLCPQTGATSLLGNASYQSSGWDMELSSSYQIQFGTYSNGLAYGISTPTGAAQPGQYTMVTLVRTGPTNALIYINGFRAATTGNLIVPAATTNSLRIGMDRLRGNFFNGNMWLVQVWSGALAPTDVANLFFIQSYGQPWPNFGGLYSGYVRNGLLEWNQFNDGRGNLAVDASGNGNSLPLINSPTWGSGFLNFDGATQYGDAGTNRLASLDLQDLSVGVWVNKTGSSFKALVDKSYDVPGFGYGGWSLRVLPNNHLEWWVEDGQEFIDTGPATITPGQWTFAQVVWHYAAQEADFYLNGILNSRPANGAAIEGASGPANFEVANMQNNASNGLYVFDGSMHDVGVFNRALSPSDVENNYLGTEPTTNVTIPDLLYYKMTEAAQTNSPAFLKDSSTHGGTTGTDLTDLPTAFEWLPNGANIPGTALHFNGVSTYLDTSNATLFNFTTNLFTINFWVDPLTANGTLMENGTYLSNGWRVSVGGSYQLQVGAETNGTDNMISTGPGGVNVGTYTMVTLVRTGPTNLLVYLNGIQAAVTGSWTSPAPSTNSLVFGKDRPTAHVLDGNIWLPQIWGEALPATSVANLYFIQSLGNPWP